MILKCTVLFLVIVAVKSAVLQGRNIPVEIRYERLGHEISSNLEEKVQLSEDEIKENNLRLQKISAADEEIDPTSDHHKFTKNFDEKVQLSLDELLQSSKHLPIENGIQGIGETDSHELPEGLRANPLSENESNADPKLTFLQQAQDIVENSLNNLKNNFKPQGDAKSPSKDLWQKLESDVRHYFTEARNKLSLRQDQGSTTSSTPTNQQQNWVQNFVNGLQQVTGNFMQNFQGQSQNPPSGTSGDEGQQQQPQPQGPFAGFFGFFTEGAQTMFNNIQSLGQQNTAVNSTVLGDTGTDNQGSQSPPTNIFGNVMNSVSQIFGGQNQGGSGGAGAGSQGGSPASNGGPFQQISSVVNNFLPGSQTQPPTSQSDEGSNTPAPSGPNGFQQVVQNIQSFGSAFTNLFQGQQSNRPQGSEDESATRPPSNNFFQNIGENIGNAFQTIQNGFRPPSSGGTTAKPSVEGGTGSSNPLVQAANAVGSQIAGAVGNYSVPNLIPGGSTQSPAEGGSSGNSNPVEQTVNLIGNQIQNQVGGASGSYPLQNLIPGSSNPAPDTSGSKEVTETKQPEKASTAAEMTEDIKKKSDQIEKKEEVMTAVE